MWESKQYGEKQMIRPHVYTDIDRLRGCLTTIVGAISSLNDKKNDELKAIAILNMNSKEIVELCKGKSMLSGMNATIETSKLLSIVKSLQQDLNKKGANVKFKPYVTYFGLVIKSIQNKF